MKQSVLSPSPRGVSARWRRCRWTQKFEDALRHMQRAGAHLAEVMGADGTVTGVLFLEDILERLVGEVRDALQKDTLPGNYRS